MKTLLIILVLILSIGVPVVGEDFSFTVKSDNEIDYTLVVPPDGWNELDTTMQTTFSASLVIDYLTTIQGLKNGASESNPIVGVHPSIETLTLYTGTCLYFNYWISRKIESKFWRFIWQFTGVSIELYCIDNNLKTLNFY